MMPRLICPTSELQASRSSRDLGEAWNPSKLSAGPTKAGKLAGHLTADEAVDRRIEKRRGGLSWLR